MKQPVDFYLHWHCRLFPGSEGGTFFTYCLVLAAGNSAECAVLHLTSENYLIVKCVQKPKVQNQRVVILLGVSDRLVLAVLLPGNQWALLAKQTYFPKCWTSQIISDGKLGAIVLQQWQNICLNKRKLNGEDLPWGSAPCNLWLTFLWSHRIRCLISMNQLI